MAKQKGRRPSIREGEPKSKDEQPTQETPQGHEIPVPTRGQVFRDLEKAAKGQRRPPRKASPARDPQEPS